MIIKLIAPKMSLRPMDSEFKRLMSPSLGLLTIASLTPSEHEIYIEDENLKKINLNDKPDLVGITVNVDTSHRAYQIASEYLQKGIPVILGGIHVSANPEEAEAHCTSVCIGDAEELWQQILYDAQNKALKKRYFHQNEIKLSNTPEPRWDLIDKAKYLYTNVIYTSRNCSFKCEFCYNSCEYAGQHRNRPIQNIIDEILKHDTKHIMFVDDNFIGNISWTRDFIRAIKPLGLTWNAAVSANIVNNIDLLDEMRESGCHSLFIGFETINQNTLKDMKKYQNNIQTYEKLIEEIHKREIMLNASIVFGFDYDTPEVFEDTLKWLVSNKIETMTAHILTPYPGTILFKKYMDDGRITDLNWEHYNTAHVVFQPKNLTKEELYKGYINIYKKFYSYENIIKRIPDSRKQLLPYLIFNLIYRKFGKLTSQAGKFGFMRKIGMTARKLSYNIE
jgi:radical SAM superfamily enzyme YgiQ (UPF0313 family)